MRPGDGPRSGLASPANHARSLDRFRGEFAILYYAFAWRARPHRPPEAEPFTIHRVSGFGDKLMLIGMAAGFEIVPVHLLLHRHSKIAAWVLTGLSVYSAIWLVALVRSLRLRPCFVEPDSVTIRLGLLFSIRIPANRIARLSATPAPGALVLPRNTEPNLCIEFTEPLIGHRIFGFRKQVTALAIAADDAPAVAAALARMA
jgi:hypothetical protein